MAKRLPKRKAIANHAQLLSQAAALEELGPSHFVRRGVILITGVIGAAAVASAFVPVVTSADGVGMVAPTGSYAAVRHLNGGVVEELLVREGDLVDRDAVLLRLRGEEQKKQFDALEAEFSALSIEEERLRAGAEKRAPDFSGFPAKYATLVADQNAVYRNKTVAREQQRLALVRRAAHAEAEVDVFRARLAGHKRQEKILRQKFGMFSQLLRKKLISRIKYLNVQQELQITRNEIASTQAEIHAAKRKMAEAWTGVAEFVALERQADLDRLSAVSGRLAEIQENLVRLRAHIDYLEVRAPEAGVVNNLKTLSPGSVVSPSDVIADIVPQNVPFVVEARMQPREIGFLHVGQEARLVVDGFDVSRFHALSGKLTHISATSLVDEEGAYYVPIKITVDADRLSDGKTAYELRAGMGVQANVITGQRSLMEYMLRPIYDSLGRVFSER